MDLISSIHSEVPARISFSSAIELGSVSNKIRILPTEWQYCIAKHIEVYGAMILAIILSKEHVKIICVEIIKTQILGQCPLQVILSDATHSIDIDHLEQVVKIEVRLECQLDLGRLYFSLDEHNLSQCPCKFFKLYSVKVGSCLTIDW